MLPVFGWLKLEGAEAAERGEDDPEETDGIGDSHEFVALVQGCGEKCCLLKLGVPTGAGP